MWQCTGDNTDLDLDISNDSCCVLLNNDEVIIKNGVGVFCPYCGSLCMWIGE